MCVIKYETYQDGAAVRGVVWGCFVGLWSDIIILDLISDLRTKYREESVRTFRKWETTVKKW